MKRRNTLEPPPPGTMTPEQARINELSKIAYERRMVLARTNLSVANGLCFTEQFLPDDLKAEWKALHAKVAQQAQAPAA